MQPVELVGELAKLLEELQIGSRWWSQENQ